MKTPGIQCMNNLHRLGSALQMYAADNNGRLPPATNWCDRLQPYVGASTPFQCALGDPGKRCHYAFNARLSGVELSQVKAPAQLVVFFETDGGWNVSGGPELLAKPGRHNRATALGFADGHSEIAVDSRLFTTNGSGQPRLRWELSGPTTSSPRENDRGLPLLPTQTQPNQQ
jgi:prepilin-type processing-associated H-X9-DG protein